MENVEMVFIVIKLTIYVLKVQKSNVKIMIQVLEHAQNVLLFLWMVNGITEDLVLNVIWIILI